MRIRFPNILVFLFALLLLLIPGAAMAGGGILSQGDDGTPTEIAGYEVISIRNADNTACYPSDAAPIVSLASGVSYSDNLLSGNTLDIDYIDEELRAAGFPEGTAISLVGPGITKDAANEVLDQANERRSENGCIEFGGPLDDEALSESGQASEPTADFHWQPGYLVVMDTEITSGSNHNAQSVILTAPTIGDNQDWFSAFLNNGFTNALPGWLLQNGLLFDGEEGSVVWTDERRGLSPIEYQMPYVVDHDYFFTISYTNGLWWLCAKDMSVGPSSYECVRSTTTEGDRLTQSINTSVWFENQNDGLFWWRGFDDEAIAFEARNYVNGAQSNWTSERQYVIWCGERDDDDYDAIRGELIHNGTARFSLALVPTMC